ncbi:MAG: ABC transporter permease [Rhizobiaceae bacterium]|nr:ABC transporter permease [Rhizobiaceae bacterium]
MRKAYYYAALAVLVAFVVLALLAPWVAPYDPNAQDLLSRLKPYSAEHWLGTDEYGRDQLSRLIFGARVSLLAAVEVVAVGLLLGVPSGVLAGFFPGLIDGALSRISDALMSVPSLVLALTIVAVLGQGLGSAMFAVGIVFTPRFFRVARASTYEVRQETFIEASFAIGCSWWRVAWRHVLPNAMSPLVVQIAVVLGAAITAEASLSFLGIGVQPPTASWGGMLSSAYQNLYEAAYLIWAPGIAIALTVLAFTALGDEARVALGTRQPVGA